jgi:Putative DNA-binding domain
MQASLFEDKEMNRIGLEDFQTLIGREENQRLEFKETVDGTPTYELAKDLSSFANAAGGYVVVGAVEDSKTKKCAGFQSLRDVEATRNKIKDVGLKLVQERLILAPDCIILASGEHIVLVFVPPAAELRAVTYDSRTEYWKRFGKDKRQMLHAEIVAAIRNVRDENLWVTLDYPAKTGLVERLNDEGFTVNWRREEEVPLLVGHQGWEYAHEDGQRFVLRIRDRPSNQVLLKKRKG